MSMRWRPVAYQTFALRGEYSRAEWKTIGCLVVPEGFELAALRPVVPVFFAYVLSFIYGGIYWNNHHHMFQLVREVNGRVLWANLHLLFWLSLLPAVTPWIGNSHLASWPTALYGAVLVMSATAYFILTRVLLRNHGPDSTLARAIGRNIKGAIVVREMKLATLLMTYKPSWTPTENGNLRTRTAEDTSAVRHAACIAFASSPFASKCAEIDASSTRHADIVCRTSRNAACASEARGDALKSATGLPGKA
jgi:uncharacterized membrane protein